MSRPGALVRFLLAVRRLGWYRYHTYEELAGASGLSLTMVKRLVSLLEKHNYIRVRYDVNTYRKLFRMVKNSIRFTDGYVWYVFDNGILDWSVDVIVDN